MRRVLKVLALSAVVALVWAPVQARADGFVIPWASGNFGNSSIESASSFGVSAGGMGAGVIGGEVDFGYAPNFFGESVNNYVMTTMGNLIVGIPIGGQHGPGIRPYVAGGVGLIRSHQDVIGASAVNNNDFGYDLGGGVMGFFAEHVGLRGDLRYFRNFQESTNPLSIEPGAFHFWRASVGLVLR